MTSIAMAVPAGVKVSEARKACRAALRELAEKKRELDWRTHVLQSDAALEKWAARNCFNSPVIRACAYLENSIPYYCEIAGFAFQKDPRRPVIQRGSRHALYRKHSLSYYGSSSNGWCSCVYDRWLRRIRYTSFEFGDDISGLDARIREAKGQLMRKHGADGRGWEKPVPSPRDGVIWLNGKRRYGLTPHQVNYIRKLYITAHKIGALEETD